MEEQIIIKDPLYKQVLIPQKYKYILDSKEFQRLRYIRQTSFTYLVYPNANHTRFSHSLGAFHLMSKSLDNGLMELDEVHKEELKLAALLHDIGHGPFSHMWEKIFDSFDHEQATQEILQEMHLDNVAKILRKESPYSSLISSSLDVDKMDYMARDSYFCGVSYGLLEGDFILQHLYVKDNKLCVKPSALSSIEDLITQRVNLFKTVYLHKVSLEYDFIFVQIFKRVKEMYEHEKLSISNQHLKSFFDQTNTVDDLLNLTDDVILSQIREWSLQDDKILSDFCEMFLYRKKLKAINLAHQHIDKQKVKQIVEESSFDESYYYGEISLPITLIQTEFYVDYGTSVVPATQVSELLAFYKDKKSYVNCIFFPKELEEKIIHLK